MQVKKLLLVGVLLALFQGIRATALTNKTAPNPNSMLDSQATATESSTAPATPDSDGSDTPVPTPTDAAITHSRLSSLILPLPPLVVPDLLLPPYNFASFNSERLDQELHLYSRYLRTFGKPDVLIVGSSRSLQGIDPIAMQEALAKQGYPRIKVFNFGINGATAQVIDVLLREVLLPEQLPRLIIWGDGLRAFNDGRPDHTYQEIIASAGYAQLQQGDRPIPPRSQWMALTLQSARKAASEAKAGPSTRTRPPFARDLTVNGFESIPGRFNPLTYFQRYPRVAGRFDADYRNFQLTGAQMNSTIAVAQFARENQIRLVMVNLPLTDEYLDQTRRSYEQQFHRHMQQLSSQEDFIFVNLGQQAALRQDQYFADPSHINQAGARAMAIALVKDKSIPWEMLQHRTSSHSQNR